jgi:F0F1-type ATP synthase membrane subunit a
VSLFFLLLIINLLWVVSDFIAPIFWFSVWWEFVLSQYFQTPSADLSFNLAIAIVSILLLLWVQFSHFGFKKAIYSYVPIFWKGYLSFSANKNNTKLYLVFYPLVKVFDIILSLFLSFLDIVGLFAKVVSLSFRLFWNIASGGVLLVLLYWALNDFTQKMSTFMGWIHFPIIFPLILYVQSTLVACIQAMVFALLVAIFIRVSQLEASQ